MAIISPNPTIQDLKLTFHESTLVSPPAPHQPKSFFLSNVDQILNYSIPTVFFFPSKPDFPPQLVVQRLKAALPRVLLTYDFVAGRLKLNTELGRLEIACNAAGVGFVHASSELTLAELGDLVCPNPLFQQLAPQTLKDNPLVLQGHGQPLFILQVTSFKCGGFALGMSVNHILLDGLSAKAFKQNLASQAFEEERPLAIPPCLDRRLLSARSPPQVQFSHPEFFKPETAPGSVGPPVFDVKREELEFRVFKITPADVKFLKEKATQPSPSSDNANGGDNTTTKKMVSSYSAVTALIWRCKALSYGCVDNDKKRVTRLLNVIDIRPRLNPPLPENYCGNGLMVAQTCAEAGELEDGPFWKAVEEVWEAPKRVGAEYARSAIDWLEVNKGLPCGDYMVSSWLRLGMEDVEFPWGKPVHCGPVANHRKDICWVFPTAGGIINALVALPAKEMELFQTHFLNFFN